MAPQALRGLGDPAVGSPGGNEREGGSGISGVVGLLHSQLGGAGQRPPGDVSIPLGREDPRTHKLTTIASPQADEQTAAQLGEEDQPLGTELAPGGCKQPPSFPCPL